jgi:hypothetical protein
MQALKLDFYSEKDKKMLIDFAENLKSIPKIDYNQYLSEVCNLGGEIIMAVSGDKCVGILSLRNESRLSNKNHQNSIIVKDFYVTKDIVKSKIASNKLFNYVIGLSEEKSSELLIDNII